MKKIDNNKRVRRIIFDSISRLSLDLKGMSVLTEAGSGAFIVTPLIAALAGAEKVYVISKDSAYGRKEEIYEYLNEIASEWDIDSKTICRVSDPLQIANRVNIVTNLGFVRPIKRDLISRLPYDSAIPLMWETWEARDEDIDFESCKEYNIPVLGTNERDERLCIFRYVGLMALKLLMEQNIEIYRSNILVVSSGEYLKEIEKVLTGNGAELFIYNPFVPPANETDFKKFVQNCDAIVIAEQKYKEPLISETEHINIGWLDGNDVKIIHIAGVLDYMLMESRGFSKYPDKKVGSGYMTVTTDYVGVRPVIELHSAGLKVGQALVEGMRIYKDPRKAKEYALRISPAMDFEEGSN